jgi:hypothetical protein
MPDPAPGPLHLIQSLAGTLSADPQTDLLSSREEAPRGCGPLACWPPRPA